MKKALIASAVFAALSGAAVADTVVAIAGPMSGQYASAGDQIRKGADSSDFVRHCDSLLRERGWRVGNTDITVICERPKVGPHALAMRERIAGLLGHVEARQDYVPSALKQITEHDGPGVVVFLRDPSLNSLAERLAGADKPAAMDRSLRAYGVGAQILLDLGVRDMIVMSSTRPEPTALEGYGLRIVGWRDMDGEDQS